MRRKCVILHEPSQSKIPLVLLPATAAWLGRDRVDRTPQFEAFKELLTANGVDITGCVPGHGAVFGWVEQEQISAIRELDEVAAINDDYAYLVQETSL